MKKKTTILGIDIGQSTLKMALVSGGVVKATASADMPDGAYKEGRPDPPEMTVDLIKQTMKENGIRATYAALSIPSENTYIKHIELPEMSEDQLKQNLPYEFNDFIDGDPNNFVFDYITEEGDPILEEPEEGEEGEQVKHLNVLGVAVLKDYIDSMAELLKKAGLKMEIAAPELSAYASIIRNIGDRIEVAGGEFGFVDLGYQKIQIYMFKNDEFMTSRELEWGLSDVAVTLADELGVDVHTARNYLKTNFDDCQNLESVRNRFDVIAVELKRSLDFYRFSNPDSQLSDIWITGGGSYIEPLIDEITAQLEDIHLHAVEELLPELADDENGNLFLKAAGIAMNQ